MNGSNWNGWSHSKSEKGMQFYFMGGNSSSSRREMRYIPTQSIFCIKYKYYIME